MTLEELKVVQLELIQVDDENNYCAVQFVPTITHCSLATLIGLSIKVQLMRLLPARFKIDVSIVPGTYVSVDAANKQLADKERVTAALENDYLRETINISLMDEISQTLPKFVEEALRKTDKLNHPKVLYIQNSRQHIESYRRWPLQVIKNGFCSKTERLNCPVLYCSVHRGC
ncbi:MIP18 family protein galla-2 [Caerostris darwini]|uniref:MIP18 family protein galla-2 n=1 Tax=Caerostris darwini TaxID=1538125 RepID=A0AAV4M533_9ARAC|nr:MIP18 family protein galla-2 [Caerostris darwini]